MSKKNRIKILLDVVMTGILTLLYNSHVSSIDFHEVAGLIVAGMFVIHCLLNSKWVTSISARFFSGSLSRRVRLSYIINFLLLVTFVLVISSGIMISEALFPNMAVQKDGLWRSLHDFFAAISIILVGIHIGLHWSFLKGMFKKIIKLPQKVTRPLGTFLLVVLLVFGTFSMGRSSFIPWLSEPFTTMGKNADLGSVHVKEEKKGAVKHFFDKKKLEGGSLTATAQTAVTYLSLFSVFAAITYYFDKYSFKKRKEN